MTTTPHQDGLPQAQATAPKHIYLDVGAPENFSADFGKLSEVSWSADNATGFGIRYVREDLAAQPLPVQGEADRDEAIRVWRRHCDKFSDALGTVPPSPVIDAMLAFAQAHAQIGAAAMLQALEALQSAPQPVEHVLPFSNVCDCTQCSSVRAAKSATAILRAAVAQ